MAIAPSAAVLECIGEAAEGAEYLLQSTHQGELALAVSRHLRLLFPRNKPPELVLPWSRADIGEGVIGEDADVQSTRPPHEMQRVRPGRMFSAGMRVDNCDVICTVFEDHDDSMSVRVNVYDPRVSESAEVIVGHEECQTILGRPWREFQPGQPRDFVFQKLCQQLRLTTTRDGDGKAFIKAEIDTDLSRPWVPAYHRLDPSEPVQPARPTGLPLVFIPADTRGDLVLRRGVKLQQVEVLMTVSTRAKGEPGKHGLVFEAYNPAISSTATLHVGSSELYKQVGGQVHLLEEDSLITTIETLLYRMLLKNGGVEGHMQLFLDYRIMPGLFATPDSAADDVLKAAKVKRRELNNKNKVAANSASDAEKKETSSEKKDEQDTK
jgi:hypothetical protein